MSAIVLNNVTKRAGRTRILDQVNLEVLEGEFFSILSVDQEAKTAIARILLNFLKPSNGDARIFDYDVNKQSKEVKGYLGFISREALFPENAKRHGIFQQSLDFHETIGEDSLEELKEYFDCQKNLKVGNMRARDRRMTSIVNALCTSPKVLLVEDATKFMEEADQRKFLARLKKLQKENNLTILFLSDDLSIAQRYSDRIAYIYEGRVKDIEYLKEKTSKDKILKVYRENLDVDPLLAIGARPLFREDADHAFYYDGALPNLTRVLNDLNLEDYNLEDAYLEDKLEAYYSDRAKEGMKEYREKREKRQVLDQDLEVKEDSLEENTQVYDEGFVHEVEAVEAVEKTKPLVTEDLPKEDAEPISVYEEDPAGDTVVFRSEDLLKNLKKGNDKGGMES